MPENFKYVPKSFTSIDDVKPDVELSTSQETKDTLNSSVLERNPVLDKIANGETLTNFTGERMVAFVKNSAEKVSKLGTKTAELFKNTVQKGGALFMPLTSGKETAFKFDTPFGLKAESLEATPLTKEVVANTVEELKMKTIEASAATEEVGHNYSHEQVASSREKIRGAVEKSAMAGAENFSFLKLIVESIKKKLREYLIGKLAENTKQTDPIKAEKARKLHKKIQKEVRVIEKLGMNGSESPTIETAAEESPSAANENVREIPKLEDEGIVNAFMMGSAANDNFKPANEEFKKPA